VKAPGRNRCASHMQYRSGAGKVFELESAGKCGRARAPGEESEKAASASHGQDRRGGDATVITECGATRGEASKRSAAVGSNR